VIITDGVIVKLTDSPGDKGNPVFPITRVEAVYMPDGVTSVDKFLEDISINAEIFPKLGTETNDNGRILRAYDSTPEGGTLLLPGVYTITSLTFTKKIHVKLTGTLILDPTVTSSDYMLGIFGDYSTVSGGGTIDGNKANALNNAGRGEGLSINAKYVHVDGIIAKGTSDSEHSDHNTFTIWAPSDHVTFDHCISIDAGYGGFVNKGCLNLTFRNCVAINFYSKGFSHNVGGKKIVLYNCYATTNSTKFDCNAFHFDAGGDGLTHEVHLHKCKFESDVISTEGANCKFEHVEYAYVTDCQFLAGGFKYGLYAGREFASGNTGSTTTDITQEIARFKKLSIRNSEFKLRCVLGDAIEKVFIDNVTIDDMSAYTYGINFYGKELYAKNLKIMKSVHGLEMKRYYPPGTVQKAVFIDFELDLKDTTGNLFRFTDNPVTLNVILNRYTVITGNTSTTTGITSVIDYDNQIKNMSNPRFIYTIEHYINALAANSIKTSLYSIGNIYKHIMQKPGFLRYVYMLVNDAITAGSLTFYLYVNGVEQSQTFVIDSTKANPRVLTITTPIQVNAGDVIEIKCTSSSTWGNPTSAIMTSIQADCYL
jgi:hypothetical protein